MEISRDATPEERVLNVCFTFHFVLNVSARYARPWVSKMQVSYLARFSCRIFIDCSHTTEYWYKKLWMKSFEL